MSGDRRFGNALPNHRSQARAQVPTHGAYPRALPRAIRERAEAITALLIDLPHTVEADRLAAEECGRLATPLESIRDTHALTGNEAEPGAKLQALTKRARAR